MQSLAALFSMDYSVAKCNVKEEYPWKRVHENYKLLMTLALHRLKLSYTYTA